MRDRFNEFVQRHDTAWELAMAALAIVFVAVGFADENNAALLAVDWALTAVFVAEFSARLLASRDRGIYLRGHWVDALALIPQARGMRVLRLLRLLRLVRAFAGVYRALASVERMAGHKGLAWIFVAWLGVMVICSIALYIAERGVNAAITSPLDAFWWGIVTLTTVGYGDVYPITPEGRLAASMLMLLGISLFAGITATITSFVIESRDGDDVLGSLRGLASLRDAGIVSPEEFEAKKAELLARL